MIYEKNATAVGCLLCPKHQENQACSHLASLDQWLVQQSPQHCSQLAKIWNNRTRLNRRAQHVVKEVTAEDQAYPVLNVNA